jgi:hypothetical protein
LTRFALGCNEMLLRAWPSADDEPPPPPASVSPELVAEAGATTVAAPPDRGRRASGGGSTSCDGCSTGGGDGGGELVSAESSYLNGGERARSGVKEPERMESDELHSHQHYSLNEPLTHAMHQHLSLSLSRLLSLRVCLSYTQCARIYGA